MIAPPPIMGLPRRRRIVQLAAVAAKFGTDDVRLPVCFALDDGGDLWLRAMGDAEWVQWPALPDREPPPAAGAIDVMAISQALRTARVAQALSLRKTAAAIGVSYSTLWRLEKGNYLADVGSLNRVLMWLASMETAR